MRKIFVFVLDFSEAACLRSKAKFVPEVPWKNVLYQNVSVRKYL